MKKALIIGSENVERIRGSLEKTGYEVHTNNDLLNGLAAFTKMGPQLVVFDSIADFSELHYAVDVIRAYEKQSKHRLHIAVLGSHSTHVYELKAKGKVDFVYPRFDKEKLDEELG
ncbi:MAG: hypothetical protein NT120_02505 [Candidatus Aenigmarchaeota archaeon]|nr:hypothetical protein [Candidatus Aenigmarchaeota archaeon]